MKIDVFAARTMRAVLPAALILFSLAWKGTASAAQANEEQRDLVARTVASHEKNIAFQLERLAEADQLRRKGEFQNALAIIDRVRLDCSIGRTHCSDEQAKRYAEVRDRASAQKASLCKEFGNVALKDARKLAAERKYEEAITRADEAGKIEPSLNAKVGEFKTYCQAKIKDRDFNSAVQVDNFQPQYKATAAQIDKLYHEATVLFDKGRYSETIKKLEEIYVLDPLNTRATHLLELTYRKVYTAATQRQIAEARGIGAHGRWVWVEPQLPTGTVAKRQAEVKVEGNEVQRRMDDIILPEIELKKGTDLSSALQYLRQLARTFDPQRDTDNGIVFMYSNGGESAAAASKTDGEGGGAQAEDTDDVKLSEMNFTNISLSDALRYICLDAGMHYRVDGNTVVIGRNVEAIRDASFSVPRSLINGILGNGSEGASGAEESSGATTSAKADTFDGAKSSGASGESSGGKDSEKLVAYFSKRGISFGKNAKITYNGRTGKLMVSNTPDNLRRLDELLRQLSVIDTPMVMTEIRIIQIQETDLEELSFYWRFTVDRQWNNGNQESILINTQNAVRESTDVVFSGVESTSLIDNLSIFPGLSEIGANLSVDINALSQHGNTETIQAPRLISESGSEAWIKMVHKTRFPDSWDAPSIETNGDATTVEFPVPDLGEYTEYGTKLTVTPKVMADNYTIELNLYTEIKDVTVVSDDASVTEENVYPVTVDRGYITEDSSGSQVRTSYEGYPMYFKVWLPEFVTHSLEVHLKVFDGQTIVMGGVTANKTSRMEDRTPILSEIPLLGRLFTAKAENNEKITLLFFVTARLIDSYGRPLNSTTDDRGIPQFN